MQGNGHPVTVILSVDAEATQQMTGSCKTCRHTANSIFPRQAAHPIQASLSGLKNRFIGSLTTHNTVSNASYTRGRPMHVKTAALCGVFYLNRIADDKYQCSFCWSQADRKQSSNSARAPSPQLIQEWPSSYYPMHTCSLTMSLRHAIFVCLAAYASGRLPRRQISKGLNTQREASCCSLSYYFF